MRWLSGVCLALVALGVARAAADEPSGLAAAESLEKTFQDVIARVEPSIACILIYRAEFPRRDNDTTPDAFGSGVVIDDKGLILTNYHVIRGAPRVLVRLPAVTQLLDVRVHAADARSDLAVLKLQGPDRTWPALPLGDGGRVRKGQLVLSIANPFAAGFEDGSPSASWGIISNIRRKLPGKRAAIEYDPGRASIHHFGTLLQLDARLNMGCSGGALVDLHGRLIGLTSSLAALTGSETSGGFAIPMSPGIRRIVERLKEGREVEYGYLGISTNTNMRPFQGPGVPVGAVFPGSPAAHAGLQQGDWIMAVDGRPVRDPDDLFLALGMPLAGSRVQLEVRRAGFGRPGGTTLTLPATLAKYYVPGSVIATNRPAPVRGLRVEYTSVLQQRTHRADGVVVPGVFVRDVVPGSPADHAHLQDAVITAVNGQAVNTPSEFYRAARQVSGPLELTLRSFEGEGSRKVTLD